MKLSSNAESSIGNRRLLYVTAIFLFGVIIVYFQLYRADENKANDLDLQTVKIGVIDQYNSEYVPETSEYYSFIAEQAERDIIQYCNQGNIGIEFDVVFYPVDEFEEMYEVVRDCRENGTNLLVGFPNNLSLDLCMGLAVSHDDMILISTGSAQSFGFTWKDTVFRLHPPRTYSAKPLAEIMYELGIRAVIPLYEYPGYENSAFNEEFSKLGGLVYESIEYSTEYGEQVDYKFEIESIDIDLERLNDVLNNASVIYQKENIGVLCFDPICIPDIVEMCQTYPDLLSVQWYSYYETEQYNSEMEKRDIVSDIRVLSLSPKISDTMLSIKINHEFRNEFGRDMSLIEANIYDGVWILALSVIEEDTTEIRVLKERIPETAAGYHGLSGLCELDAVGDRKNLNYNIWGYEKLENNTRRTLYGVYEDEKINWIKTVN